MVSTNQKKSKKQSNVDSVAKISIKPIAVKSREILILANQITSKVPHTVKYTLGTAFSTNSAKLGYAVYDALDVMGQNQDKLNKIEIIFKKIHECLLMVDVLKDINGVSRDQYEEYVNAIVSVKIQATNWYKSIEAVLNPSEEQNNVE